MSVRSILRTNLGGYEWMQKISRMGLIIIGIVINSIMSVVITVGSVNSSRKGFMSFLSWLLTPQTVSTTATENKEPHSSKKKTAASQAHGYEEQRRLLSVLPNLGRGPQQCTMLDKDGDGTLDVPPPGIDFDFNRGPSMRAAPELNCGTTELLNRLERKYPGFRLRWTMAGPLNLSGTSAVARHKLLTALAEERTLCQSGSY